MGTPDSGFWNLRRVNYIAQCRWCGRRVSMAHVKRNECPNCHRELIMKQTVKAAKANAEVQA